MAGSEVSKAGSVACWKRMETEDMADLAAEAFVDEAAGTAGIGHGKLL